PAVKATGFEGALTVREDPEQIVVLTGLMQVALDKKKFFLFKKVHMDLNANGVTDSDEEIVSGAFADLVFRGEEYRADWDDKTSHIAVEEKGSQRVVVRASGWFQSRDGKRYCRLIVRYYFYQGKSDVKISHTLIYTGYPENRFLDAGQTLKLPENETIDAIGIKLPWQSPAPRVRLGQLQQGPLEFLDNGSIGLMQAGWQTANLATAVPEAPTEIWAEGWMDIADDKKGMAVALRNFRENFPKAFKVQRQILPNGHPDARRAEGSRTDDGPAVVANSNEGAGGISLIQIDLWPKEAGVLDLATTQAAKGDGVPQPASAFGLAKTHELLFHFHPGNVEPDYAQNRVRGFAERLTVRVNPYWVDATGALGRLFPADKRYGGQEQALERLFDWAARQPFHFGWYGMLNFGDTLTWFRDRDDAKNYGVTDWHPEGQWGWYNCEGAGTHTGALLQFIRSGIWKYFKFGENLTRHIMDVDTVHHDTVRNDPRLKKALDAGSSRVGSMHGHDGNHWGGPNADAGHTHVLGLLLYYYLTGDERAMEVAGEAGEFFLTEPFAVAGHPDIAPLSALANVLWGDVLLFEATGDDRYKRGADRIIDLLLRAQRPDGSFLEIYNPKKKTWSGQPNNLFMAGNTVGALIRYHELTQDADVKEMFLKLVRYLAKDEEAGPMVLHGLAYAYLMTGDMPYIAAGEQNMKKFLALQQLSSEPVADGMIGEKLIYRQPNFFLSTVPYIFGAIEEGIARLDRKQ
ncbi:MAG: glycoside hydrolase family 127 protein, partial [Candidatus Omnitrophica bacterium]|nr:glycoside hydrolase family 127 protein [Candidatus Omnitrophota bacterium]